MTDIEKLAEALHREFPAAELRLQLSPSFKKTGWLDILHAGRFVAVEWRPAIGFGVSLIPDRADPLEGLFQGPDEVFDRWPAARDRIRLLLEDAPAQAPLRRARG